MKKFLCSLLALVMVLSLTTMPVMAEETPAPTIYRVYLGSDRIFVDMGNIAAGTTNLKLKMYNDSELRVTSTMKITANFDELTGCFKINDTSSS